MMRVVIMMLLLRARGKGKKPAVGEKKKKSGCK